jgi:predicted nucleic acid-binding protein
MEYLADTVTVVRHFSRTGKIGKRVKAILEGVERGEHHLYISTISLVEIMYLSEKNRIIISLKDTLKVIDNAMNYSIVDLRSNIVQLAEHTSDKRIIDIDLV